LPSAPPRGILPPIRCPRKPWGAGRASSSGLRPDRTRSTIRARNSAGYGGRDFGILDSSAHQSIAVHETGATPPRRIFILGHSLGGYLLPRIALAAEPLGLAGFISLAGPTRSLEELILQQTNHLLSLAGDSLSAEEKKQLDELAGAVARIRALSETDKGSTTRILGAMPAYWLDLRGYDPAAAAKKVTQPMLFLQGGRDYQVTAEDLEGWKRALGDRADVGFRLFPRLNHLFFEGEGTITPLEYTQRHGSVALAVIEEIATFLGVGRGGKESPKPEKPS
jgi:hypothetical protein